MRVDCEFTGSPVISLQRLMFFVFSLNNAPCPQADPPEGVGPCFGLLPTLGTEYHGYAPRLGGPRPAWKTSPGEPVQGEEAA